MDEIAHRRAQKAQDCRLLKPKDILEELLEDINSKRRDISRMVIVFTEGNPLTGPYVQNFRLAGVTRSENIAMLAIAQHNAIADGQQ